MPGHVSPCGQSSQLTPFPSTLSMTRIDSLYCTVGTRIKYASGRDMAQG